MEVPASIFRDFLQGVKPDPFENRPEGAEKFDLKRSVTIAAGVTTEFFSLKLEGNEHCRLEKLGMEPDLNGVVAMEDTLFSIRVNEAPLKFYEALVDQIGTGPLPTEIWGFIQEPGATISVRATNNHAVTAAKMFCRLVGWRFTVRSPRGRGR